MVSPGQHPRQIFLVTPRWDEFRFIDLDSGDYEDLDPLRFDGSPVDAQTWRSPPLYAAEPRKRRPDIWGIWSVAALAFEPARVRDLGSVPGRSGQLLPLTVSHEDLVALNVTAVADCLDPRSHLAPGVRGRCHFIAHRLPDAPLFKVADSATAEIFCLEDPNDPEPGFKARYEQYRWHGIDFDLVWSEDTGPVDEDPGLRRLLPPEALD